jgi:hypothetical protein
MRPWLVILVCATGCESSDDDAGDDDPADTDAPGDTDTPEDTDLPGDTDTDTEPAGLDCTFEACGGDVVGNWNLVGVCLPDFGNPFAESCPTSTFSLTQGATGTFDILQDGTFQMLASLSLDVSATFPAECNAELASCDDWSLQFAGLVCTGEVTGTCECGSSVGPLPAIANGEWAYDGDDVWFDGLAGEQTPDGGGGGPQEFAYCQDGDSLKLRLKGGYGSQYVLSR